MEEIEAVNGRLRVSTARYRRVHLHAEEDARPEEGDGSATVFLTVAGALDVVSAMLKAIREAARD